MNPADLAKYFAQFEAQGESLVRVTVVGGGRERTDPAWFGAATEWLRLKDEERAVASASKRDAREIKTLRIAVAAIIIAVIAAAKEIKWLATSIMAWLQ